MKRKVLLTIVTGLTLLILPAFAIAAMSEMTGTIMGLSCAQMGENCPADKMDPHVATESGFVVMMEGGKHLLVTGVDKAVLARHVTEKVKVMGKVNDKYATIQASAIMTMKDGKWMETWSRKGEDEERAKSYLP